MWSGRVPGGVGHDGGGTGPATCALVSRGAKPVLPGADSASQGWQHHRVRVLPGQPANLRRSIL